MVDPIKWLEDQPGLDVCDLTEIADEPPEEQQWEVQGSWRNILLTLEVDGGGEPTGYSLMALEYEGYNGIDDIWEPVGLPVSTLGLRAEEENLEDLAHWLRCEEQAEAATK